MKYFTVTLAFAVVIFLTATGLGSDGSKEGPHRWTRMVKKNSEVTYKLTFNAAGGKGKSKGLAEFAVIGDGSSNVDIFVFDADGKDVVSDTNATDIAVVRWQVEKTQEFTIKVRNLGTADNMCTMGHN